MLLAASSVWCLLFLVLIIFLFCLWVLLALENDRSDGTFFLIPQEVMRRHGAFLGQEFPLPPVRKGDSRQTKAEDKRYLGRSTVTLFTAEHSPHAEKNKAWQRLCKKYCLSWDSEAVRADVEAVLLGTF